MGSPLSDFERIKADSRFLRGTIAEGLSDPVTGAISDDDGKLLKFHGSYQQDDRDLRDERRRQKLEPAYSFMLRARLPGGVVTPAQWLVFDRLAREYANGTLRITTRQTFQWHGIIKRKLKPTIAAIRVTSSHVSNEENSKAKSSHGKSQSFATKPRSVNPSAST